MGYLDEDALYNNIEEKYKVATGEARKAYSDALDTICEMPRADVTEVRKLEQLKWERDTAIAQLQSYDIGFGESKELTEVKHGEWIYTGRFDCNKTPIYQCSVCQKEVSDSYINLHKYCLHCGAKMDGNRRKIREMHLDN